MNCKRLLTCLLLTATLSLIFPMGGILADTTPENLVASECSYLEQDNLYTIYFSDDGEIKGLVKGVPKGVSINLKVIPTLADFTRVPLSKGMHTISNQLTYPSNPHETGPSLYCSEIEYAVQVSANCETFFGMYNTSGHYAVGQYVGPYPSSYTVTGTVTAWDDYWSHRISYYGALTNYINGVSYY